MILQAAKHVNEVMSLQAIKDVIETNVFWDLATEEKELPFVNFKLSNTGTLTKDGIAQYAVEMFVFANSLNQGGTIADAIETAIKESSYNWKFKGNETGYNYSDGREGLCTINYEFKF